MEKYIDSVVSLPCSVGIVWRSTFIVWSVYLVTLCRHCVEKYIYSVVSLSSGNCVEKYIDSVVSLSSSVGIVWRSTLIVWSAYPAL